MWMSNTATTAMMITLVVPMLAQIPEGDPIRKRLLVSNTPIQVGVSIALAASLAMALPISTPPNTIAYCKGELVTADFTRNGVVIGLISIVLIYSFGSNIIDFWLHLL